MDGMTTTTRCKLSPFRFSLTLPSSKVCPTAPTPLAFLPTMCAGAAFVVGPKSHYCASLVYQVTLAVANTWVFVVALVLGRDVARPVADV